MINVGGYKVNPQKSEDVLRNIIGVKDVRVFAKSNSVLGNIVCLEIVRLSKDLNEYQIRSYFKRSFTGV
ncbi:MAG: hypothetical protein U5N56_00730 [Candidatus Marinimicrobia bacterium]|nr:hypothetical protein [Candidatus Neomarinimicrobiota bacterium]